MAVRVRVRRALAAGSVCIALLALGATAAHAESHAPIVENEEAANVTSVAATLRASVNPEFAETEYYFEYGPTVAYGSNSPAPPGTRISGKFNTLQIAKTALSGLTPGTTYHFRVVAVNSMGTTDGSDQTFTTGTPGPPVVESERESAANVTATSADLTAEVDAEYLETSYYLEYGATLAYGLRAPIPEATLAAAGGTQRVAVLVENLQPNTTYYFRLVATNALGTVTASPGTFTTYPPGEAFSLPDNRVYELVSPPDKNGGDVGGGQEEFAPSRAAFGESSASGGAITYASSTSFGDAQGAELTTQYLSTRGPSSWTTHAISPPAATLEKNGLVVETFHVFTPELTAWVFSWQPPPGYGVPQKVESLFRGEAGSSTYQLINDETPANAGNNYEVKAIGASSDLRHVVFEAGPPGAPSVYEWTPGFPLRLVSVLPGPGEVAAANARGAGVSGGNGGSGAANMLPNLVSAGGSRIFWVDGNNQLYVREDGTTTVQLNASQRTPSLGDGTAQFMAATPDGSRVFFIDETALTNGAGDNGGLYEYSFAGGGLTDLTPDAGGSPGVGGVVGIGEEGASVYFVAGASLTSNARPGAGQPSPGQENLYVARQGTLTFIATLSSEDYGDWANDFAERTAEVTPDGDQLAFVSSDPLTGYDNADLNTGKPDAEVFLYDAGVETLRCVSCNPSGELPIGPASVPTPKGTEHLPRYLSEDGQRVFFDSNDALLPAASNGLQNVYEYENGAIHLISSGTSDEDSILADASANGDNVFFTTNAQLVPEDQDESFDMYDARVDGGFPVTAAPPAPCTEEGCRGPVTAPPAPLTIVTEEAHGVETSSAQPADAPPPAPRAGGHKAKKPKHKPSTKTKSSGKRKSSARRSARRARRSRRAHRGRRVGSGQQATSRSQRPGRRAGVRGGGVR
jgi:hypothetical protein